MSEPPVYGAHLGSAARGDMRPDSDIDILLVRADGSDLTGWENFTDHLSRQVTRWTGNDAQIFDLDESAARAAAAGLAAPARPRGDRAPGTEHRAPSAVIRSVA